MFILVLNLLKPYYYAILLEKYLNKNYIISFLIKYVKIELLKLKKYHESVYVIFNKKFSEFLKS